MINLFNKKNFSFPKELTSNPFKFSNKEKNIFFKNNFYRLNNYHLKNCLEFKNLTKFLKIKSNKSQHLSEYFYLPVSIFKKHNLVSVKRKSIIREIVSSGTSGNLSKILLDKVNSINQRKILSGIVSTFIGKDRLPMLIIDNDPRTSSDKSINARKAAIYGFGIFGKNVTYALDSKNQIDYISVNNFLNKYKDEKILIFGFTHLIYIKLVNEYKFKKNIKKNIFKNAILIHGGGWKKVEKLKVSRKLFNKKIQNKFNISRIHNYYGMVEQTGSIFFECHCGYLTTSMFSDVIIRDKNFNPLNVGKKGLIQLLSLVPTSYPGHNILTEDIGEEIEEVKCKCEIRGKKFIVHGRLDKAETRGCSNV